MTERQPTASRSTKSHRQSQTAGNHPGYRIAVICHDIVLAGGLLRFDRVGNVLSEKGHEMVFVTLSENAKYYREPELEVLSLDEALKQKWDAVMLPGAGFPNPSLELLSLFKRDTFGVRIQHILNDQTLKDRFKLANKLFRPHVVVFNNLHWPQGSYSDLKADHFAFLLGGVDARKFQPENRTYPLNPGRWVIGGCNTKNPEVLIAALRKLPDNFALRLFGYQWDDRLAVKNADLVANKRLEFTGALHGQEMIRFYQDVDCVAMTEKSAGWSNMVAEAMASGVPSICTRHGTNAFATHEKTALLFEPNDSSALAEAIKRLATDEALCRTLTKQARSTIEQFSWESYSRGLLDLIALKSPVVSS